MSLDDVGEAALSELTAGGALLVTLLALAIAAVPPFLI